MTAIRMHTGGPVDPQFPSRPKAPRAFRDCPNPDGHCGRADCVKCGEFSEFGRSKRVPPGWMIAAAIVLYAALGVWLLLT